MVAAQFIYFINRLRTMEAASILSQIKCVILSHVKAGVLLTLPNRKSTHDKSLRLKEYYAFVFVLGF